MTWLLRPASSRLSAGCTDDYDGYALVKDALKSTGVMLSTAEHEYTRYGFRQLIAASYHHVPALVAPHLRGCSCVAQRVFAATHGMCCNVENPFVRLFVCTLTRKR